METDYSVLLDLEELDEDEKEKHMQIGILGSGTVGQQLSAGLSEIGHEVMIGTRDAGKLKDWQSSHPNVRVGSFAETAAYGQMVFNAVNGAGSLNALTLAGSDNLAGKILVDVANPLDFSNGFPPSLTVCGTDSLAEQIQRTFPTAKVVKTLNTVTAQLMTRPRAVANGDHHIFISSNDGDAKAQVTTLLQSLGWIHIIDLGDLSTARGTEAYLLLWVRLYGAMNTGMLNVKVMK